MPSNRRAPRPAMYNTPAIRNGGFGALQVEAIANRPLSIARRHLAASQLRMRDIEPDQLSSSEWVRFLVMEEYERERWMTRFVRHRRNSEESTESTGGSSPELDRETAYHKEEEAREEAEEARRIEAAESSSSRAVPTALPTPAASIWARQFDQDWNSTGREWGERAVSPQPLRHARRAAMDDVEGPPSYDTVVRAHTPPPAYEPRSDNEGSVSPQYERRGFQFP